jgi:hypothetical protein
MALVGYGALMFFTIPAPHRAKYRGIMANRI